LAALALGSLGWTEREALRSDVNTIHLALEGKDRLLESIFGKAESEEEKKAGPSLETFKDFARRHNAVRAAKREAKAAKGKGGK
jgi:hypothetical protein